MGIIRGYHQPGETQGQITSSNDSAVELQSRFADLADLRFVNSQRCLKGYWE